jgi:MFS transporter, FHS family, glucose/mannose:H+ symporter
VHVATENSLARSRSTLSVLLHLGFVLTGVVNTMLGPLLPILSTRWGLNDAQAGYLFTAQFTGSMLGVFGSSFLGPRKGSRFSLVMGLLTMAAGSATLALGNRGLGLASAFCFGTGLGLTIPTTNLLISDLNPDRRAAALNLVNFSWGIGAVACPFLVALLQQLHRSSDLLFGVAALLVLLAGAVARTFPALLSDDRNKAAPMAVICSTGLWRRWVVLILGSIFFLYVGTETATGGWAASYARRILTIEGNTWAMMPSFFWAALLLGRVLAPLGLRRLSELTMARAGLGLAALGIIALHSATNETGLIIAMAVAGLGLSSVFPIAIAALSHEFGEAASRIAGLMFALAGLGGATLPWLVGYASTWYGSLRFGLSVPLCGCLAMLFLFVLLHHPLADTARS